MDASSLPSRRCLTCRDRRVKCGGQTPRCQQCAKGSRECLYGDGTMFRHAQSVLGMGTRKGKWDFARDHFWVRSSFPFKFIDETELIVDGYLVISDDPESSLDVANNELESQAVFSQSPSAPGQPVDQESNPKEYRASDASDHIPLLLTSPASRDQISPSQCQTNSPGSVWGDFLDQSPTVSLTPNEAILLHRFTQVVGQWMDLSDLSQTWSNLVPHFATRASLVKECCVACAAKQLALSNPQNHRTEEWMRQAQSSYSIAIEQLIRHVSIDCPAPSPETFVATVLCSVYEMIDATGSDWQAHLEGISQIGKMRGINGTCGGLEEAAFWCFARQEVVCCLINRSKPRIDPESWYEILGQRTEVGREDMANRRILTILAKICHSVHSSDARSGSLRVFQHLDRESKRLTSMLQFWKDTLPLTCEPISITRQGDDVFDTIYFTLGTAASAWQMYHLCNILLLTSSLHQGCQSGQEIENKLRFHALQICGVALGRPDGGARVHSVQAIYYAGRCLTDIREQDLCAILLCDIEEDLGWAAKYRVRDLYVAWNRENESPA